MSIRSISDSTTLQWLTPRTLVWRPRNWPWWLVGPENSYSTTSVIPCVRRLPSFLTPENVGTQVRNLPRSPQFKPAPTTPNLNSPYQLAFQYFHFIHLPLSFAAIYYLWELSKLFGKDPMYRYIFRLLDKVVYSFEELITIFLYLYFASNILCIMYTP